MQGYTTVRDAGGRDYGLRVLGPLPRAALAGLGPRPVADRRPRGQAAPLGVDRAHRVLLRHDRGIADGPEEVRKERRQHERPPAAVAPSWGSVNVT
jgi:hypothetical protein